MDKSGVHGVSCRRAAGTFSRHAALTDIIHRVLSSVNVPSILEPIGMFLTDGKRPDGLTLIPWSPGECLAWDTTCRNTLASSCLSSISNQPGAAAESRKRVHYAAMPGYYSLRPFAVKTMGSFGEDALQLAKELGGRLQAQSGETRATSFVLQRISTAIQRGNAASVLASIPK